LVFVEISYSKDNFITVASTTSTENSGFLNYLLPKFSNKTGIFVRVIAVGTGQAIEIAKRGDADILLVHHRKSEQKFVDEGFGVRRYDLMFNHYVIVGPGGDPANIRQVSEAEVALKKIFETQSNFVSRGDNSGTHKFELGLWKMAGIKLGKDAGNWYRELGTGMGATLNTAANMLAYTIADRATWLSFKNKMNLEVLLRGDAKLKNSYGVILVSSQKHPHVKRKKGETFIDWLTSREGQDAIGQFSINGEQLFKPYNSVKNN
tara:strand:- start:11 stop:799 length:789 start_codon:yes stop_codon:yes gene_type:complete